MSGRRRLSTGSRVALAVTAVLAIGVLALSAIAYGTTERRLYAEVDARLAEETRAYAGAVAGTTAKRRDLVAETRSYLRRRSSSGLSRPVLLVRFRDGRVLSNSEVDLEHAPGNRTRLDAADPGEGYATFTYRGERYRAATVPVDSPGGEVVAVFQAAMPLGPIDATVRGLALTLLLAGAGVTLAGALVSALAARTSLRPLRRAAATAHEVTQSSLARRVDYEGPNDEVGRMVAALNDMLARLEAAFEEQRRFIADAAHELRTPLAIIKGNLELQDRVELTDEDRVEARALMAEEIERMSRLTTDLLTLARLESDRTHPAQDLEVSSLVAEAVARARSLNESAEVRYECPQGLWVRSDADRMMQALLNLLRNALAHVPDETGEVVVRCGSAAGRVHIDVRNNGPHVKEESLPHLFERFYRAGGGRSVDSGGSGLGLAITLRLLEIDGGRVTARNRPEGGVSFTIDLPQGTSHD